MTFQDLQNCKMRLIKKASATLSDPEVQKYVGEYMMNLKVSKEKLGERIFEETGKRVTSKQLEDYQLKLENKRSLKVASNFQWIKPEEEDMYDLPTKDVVTSENTGYRSST